MDWVLILKAVIMGVVEGITEFLPISSTGHLIITGQLLGFMDHDRRAVFEIAIQLGAILSICWIYHQRLWNVASTLHTPASQRFVINLAIAFLPAAILRFPLHQDDQVLPVPPGAGGLCAGGRRHPDPVGGAARAHHHGADRG